MNCTCLNIILFIWRRLEFVSRYPWETVWKNGFDLWDSKSQRFTVCLTKILFFVHCAYGNEIGWPTLNINCDLTKKKILVTPFHLKGHFLDSIETMFSNYKHLKSHAVIISEIEMFFCPWIKDCLKISKYSFKWLMSNNKKLENWNCAKNDKLHLGN